GPGDCLPALRRRWLERGKKLPNAFREFPLLHDQADDQVTVRLKIIKMSRMKVDALVRQQINREIIIWASRRNAKHGIPTAFDLQSAARFFLQQLAIQFRYVAANSRHYLLLEAQPLL